MFLKNNVATILTTLSCAFAVAKTSSSEKKLNPNSIYNLSSTWTNHNSEKKVLSDFQGQQLLIAMVYTSCQHTCPLITNKLKKIVDSNKKTKKLKVLMVTFDPDRDTPEALNKYFKKMKLNDNWILLTGRESDIRELAAVLGVNYKKDSAGEFSHSNIITLLSPDGVIKAQLQSLGEDISSIVKSVN